MYKLVIKMCPLFSLKKLVLFGVFLSFFACKPNPETARQTHSSFLEARNKQKITRITESALIDSVDAITQVFVHELNNSLIPLLIDSVYHCGETNLKQPAPHYVLDYQFLCDENITLQADENVQQFLKNSFKAKIERDTVLKIKKQSFLYVSPVYSDSTYTGVWGVLVSRKGIIQSL